MRIADNRISENGGGWDADLLNVEIGELCQLEDIADITITGFNDIEIDQILTEPRNKTEIKKLDMVPYVAGSSPAARASLYSFLYIFS